MSPRKKFLKQKMYILMVKHCHNVQDLLSRDKFIELRADTAGSAEMVSKSNDKKKAAIASSLSAKTYNLKLLKKI